MAKRRFVFDLDDTLESPGVYRDEVPEVAKWVRARWGEYADKCMIFPWEYNGDPMEYRNGSYTFFAFPGAIELLRWVHAKGIAMDFFSGAIPERNIDLCRDMMAAAFPDGDIPPYRVFCTRTDSPADSSFDGKEYREKYCGFYYGQRKKVLRGLIVPPEEVPDTLLVDDDESYAAKDEEGNLVCYNCGCSTFSSYQSEMEHGEVYYRHGLDMHHVFYLAGILDRILEVADEKGMTLRDASVQVQYLDDGLVFPKDKEDYWAHRHEDDIRPYTEDRKYFERGLKVLQSINPALDYWSGIGKQWWYDNGHAIHDNRHRDE